MTRKSKTPTITTETIDTVKGFKPNMTCRGFQFEIGKTYIHDGDVEACASGFHACENPIDVFGYYPPGTSRYAEVKQGGRIGRHNSDSKIASATITIGVEIKLHDMIERAIKWIFAKAKPSDVSHAEGYRSAAMSAGKEGCVLGVKGNALFLVYRDPNTWEILHAWAGIVGRDGIKADTFYTLAADGRPVEVVS